MLCHHDHRTYAQAASEAAANARSKLEALIATGRRRAAEVVETIRSQQPEDRLVRGEAMEFLPNATKLLLKVGDQEERLHRHALHQAAKRAGVPWSYVQHLQLPEHQPWGLELLSRNLNELYRQSLAPETRFLVRSVAGEVRGILSDRFRRLDSRPIVDSFAASCADIGALPVEGYVTDTKVAIKAVLPQVYEPVPHEVMAFGAVLENSDFGHGALSIRTFCLRLWCTNYAIADTSIREVHLGSRLADDITWSEKTYSLDTRRMASAVRDVVKGQLSAPCIERFEDAIRRAHDQHIDPRQAITQLRKSLTKADTDQVVEKFNSPDVELLPPGNTTWRLSNAVSWLAGETEDAAHKLELMRVAGALLPKAA